MLRLRWHSFLPGVLFFGALLGCGGADGPPFQMIELKGKVALNGKPVDRVTLSFTPVEAGRGQEDLCLVENGSYQTKIVAARYKVAVQPASGGTNIPARYRKVTS